MTRSLFNYSFVVCENCGREEYIKQDSNGNPDEQLLADGWDIEDDLCPDCVAFDKLEEV